MSRALPLQKRFPGKVVARIKIWFPTWVCGIEGPIPPELATLIVAVVSRDPDDVARAELAAFAERWRERADKPKKAPSDKALRKEVSKARDDGRIGRKK